MADSVYTIGHSTHSIQTIIEFLTLHNITAVGDVRSQPYSRFNPQFNRENLRADLKRADLSYVFLGRELGARTEDRGCYVEGTVQYDLLAHTEAFQEGLRRIAEGSRCHKIALLCAEKDPLVCHRSILVCRHLASRGIRVQHILGDGRIESHDQAMTRLLNELGLTGGELFRTRDEVVIEAYERRGRQIAYTEKDQSPKRPFHEVRE